MDKKTRYALVISALIVAFTSLPLNWPLVGVCFFLMALVNSLPFPRKPVLFQASLDTVFLLLNAVFLFFSLKNHRWLAGVNDLATACYFGIDAAWTLRSLYGNGKTT